MLTAFFFITFTESTSIYIVDILFVITACVPLSISTDVGGFCSTAWTMYLRPTFFIACNEDPTISCLFLWLLLSYPLDQFSLTVGFLYDILTLRHCLLWDGILLEVISFLFSIFFFNASLCDISFFIWGENRIRNSVQSYRKIWRHFFL